MGMCQSSGGGWPKIANEIGNKNASEYKIPPGTRAIIVRIIVNDACFFSTFA